MYQKMQENNKKQEITEKEDKMDNINAFAQSHQFENLDKMMKAEINKDEQLI